MDLLTQIQQYVSTMMQLMAGSVMDLTDGPLALSLSMADASNASLLSSHATELDRRVQHLFGLFSCTDAFICSLPDRLECPESQLSILRGLQSAMEEEDRAMKNTVKQAQRWNNRLSKVLRKAATEHRQANLPQPQPQLRPQAQTEQRAARQASTANANAIGDGDGDRGAESSLVSAGETAPSGQPIGVMPSLDQSGRMDTSR